MNSKRMWCFIGLFALVLVVSCSDNKTQPGYSRITRIGIISIVEHPFLEQAREGFKNTFREQGYIEGKTVEYDYRNAYGKMENANTIASAFVGKKVDLIYGIATPTTQAVKEKTTSIPIVFAAVTDPVGAKLVQSLEKPGGNVTGVSDMIPVRYQLEVIKKVLPNLKKLGVPYNAGESNSVSLLTEMRKHAPGMGIEIVEATASTSADVSQAVTSLAQKADAIYMPTDNTMGAAVTVISDICMKFKKPFFSSENETIKNDGALAALSVDHYKLGQKAALMAIRILKDKAKAADMPVERLGEYDLEVNMRVAKKLGLSIPEKALTGAKLIQ